MKSALIIPIKNQDKYISRMLHAINIQSVKPDMVYFMIDRPTDKEYNVISQAVEKQNNESYKLFRVDTIPDYIGNGEDLDNDELFLAGDRRNLAIKHAIDDGCDIFIFIDGDCIPQRDLVKSHINACNRDFPILSVGRRREKRFKNLDQRDIDVKVMNKNLFKLNETIIHDVTLLLSSSIVWSCNISMNMRAIAHISQLNKEMFDRYEVFSSEFSGRWGGEDTYLGLQAYASKVIIVSINSELSGVMHIDHPRPINKYDPKVYNDFLSSKVKLIEDMFKDNPLTLDFYNRVNGYLDTLLK